MLEKLSAEEIVSHIISKQITAEEVIEHYLNRINRFNDSLNAIVSLKDEEIIRDEAKRLKQNNKDSDKLLFGLPMAIKDLTDVEGLPTTYGLTEYRNNFPSKNSIIVDRLIDQGTIIIGKTNTPELGLGSHTTNKLFGPTANIFDQNKTAGGSSGGAATAVGASLVPFADGSDMMGSCRNPAAYTNLYGFRATPGLIPEYRNMKIDKQFPLLTTPGCLTRSPAEMALLLDAIAGKHSSDPFSFDPQSSFREHQINDDDFSKLKIGWLSNMDGAYKFEDGIIDLCETALDDLDKTELQVAHLKSEINSTVLWDSWTTLRSKNIFNYLNEMKLDMHEELGLPVRWEYEKGSGITSNDIQISLGQRSECKNIVEKLFMNFDFLVMPSAQVFPFDKELKYPEEISEYKLDTYHRWMEVVTLASLLGLPTISVPVGFNKNGLPMGMQIIGKKGDDLRVVSFAKKYEEIFNFSEYTHIKDVESF
jgi:amidase